MVGQQKKIRDTSSSVDTIAADGGISTTTTTKSTSSSPKSRLAMLKRSTIKRNGVTTASSNDPFRFQGSGIDFKAKLIGEREVDEPRGDAMCAEAMKLTKASIKSSGAHKQRIILNISIEGLKIRDEKTGVLLYNFPVSKISFIARDTTDARAFGFIFGTPEGKYKFYGTKTAQTADHAVLSIRDMFQVVFEMKKKQLHEARQKQEEQENIENDMLEQNGRSTSEADDVAVADLLNLETEVENIGQGVNQLRNIPSMPEDDFFSTSWIPPIVNAGKVNGTANNIFLNGHSKEDPFGDSFTSISHNGFSNSSDNTFKKLSQPADDPFQINYTFRPSSHPLPISSMPPASNMIATKALVLDNNFWPGTTNIAANASQPNFMANFTNTSNGPERNNNWPSPTKLITTLEEAFTKLVDMNALVTSNPIKNTNPFAAE